MTSRRCIFTPSRYRSEPEESTVKRVIAEQTDPPGFTVKFINDYIGNGVFTTEKRRAGTFLFEYSGELISGIEGCKREKRYPAHFGSFIYFFKVGRTKWCVDATFSKQIGKFANDAVGSDKNAEVKVNLVDKTPHLVLFATRNIASGEEIRFDYGVDGLPWRKAKKEDTCTAKATMAHCEPVVVLNDIKQDPAYKNIFLKSIEKQHTELEQHIVYRSRLKLDGTEDVTFNDMGLAESDTSNLIIEGTLVNACTDIISSVDEDQGIDLHEKQPCSYFYTASLVNDGAECSTSAVSLEDALIKESTNTGIVEDEHKGNASTDSKQTDCFITDSLVDDRGSSTISTNDVQIEDDLVNAMISFIISPDEPEDSLDSLLNDFFADSIVDDREIAKSGTSNGSVEETSDKETDSKLCLEISNQDTTSMLNNRAENQVTNEEKSNECSSYVRTKAQRPDIFCKKRIMSQSVPMILQQVPEKENLTTNIHAPDITAEQSYTEQLRHSEDESTETPYTLIKEQFTDECVVLCVKDQRISKDVNNGKDWLDNQLNFTDSPVKDRGLAESSISIGSPEETPVKESTNTECLELKNRDNTSIFNNPEEDQRTCKEKSNDCSLHARTATQISDIFWKKRISKDVNNGKVWLDNQLNFTDSPVKDRGLAESSISIGSPEETPVKESTNTECLELKNRDNTSISNNPEEDQRTCKEKSNECSLHARTATQTSDIFWKKRLMRQSVPMEPPPEKENLTASMHAPDTIAEHSDTVSPSKKWKKKPSRPCPYCGLFRTKLTNHLRSMHRHETAVTEALLLPPQEMIEAFSKLRKTGIMLENVKRMDNDKNKNKGGNSKNLIRERRQGRDTLVTCLSCKAFLSKRQFHKHRKNCFAASSSKPPPNCLTASIFKDSKDKEKYLQYESEILETFRSDDVGKLCKNDIVITAYGFQKYLSIGERNEKKDEKRKSIMTTMRQIARLFLDFKDYLLNLTKSENVSVESMFMRENWKHVKEVLLSKKSASNNDSLLLLGNNIKRFSKFLYDYFCDEDQDEKAGKVHKFRESLKFNWPHIFGESECKALISRSETRKPANLPDEDELKILTKWTIKSLKEMSEDTYNFFAESDFTFLRDLAVCRLTLFNARRGGEPSRLTLDEWKDADNDIWKRNINSETLRNPEDIELVKKFKVAYQRGKRDGNLVPVLFPDDCLGALKILTDPQVRKDANVNTFNPYLFPRTHLSDKHVIGSDSIRNICIKASIQPITATKVRHRAATMYAQLDVDDEEKSAFYKHLGHSEKINKHVYQCPPALAEVTKVGKFLQMLDTDLLSKKPQRKTVNATAPSPFSCSDSLMSNEEPLYETTSSHDLSEVKPSTSNTEDVFQEINCLKGFLYAVAESYAVDRVLRISESLIEEHEVETIPERIEQTRPDITVLNAAKPFFTSDAWLAVESLIGCLKANEDSTVTDLETKHVHGNGSGIQHKSKDEELETTSSSEDDENEPIPKKRKKVTDEMQYVQWRKEDTEKVNHYFAKQVFDITRYDLKGNLPGYTQIRKFLKMNPSVLPNLPTMTRIRKVHTKLFNERNKARRRAKTFIKDKGNKDVWHGTLDIILDSCDIGVRFTPEPEETSPGGRASIEIKCGNVGSILTRDQALAQTITFSFLQNQRHSPSMMGHCLIPCILASSREVQYFFYDSDNDILLQSRKYPLFITVGDKLELSYQTIIATWLVLNYKYLCSGPTKYILDAPKAGFPKFAGPSIKIYKSNLKFQNVCCNASDIGNQALYDPTPAISEGRLDSCPFKWPDEPFVSCPYDLV